MVEEKKKLKSLKTEFVGGSELSTHFANIVHVSAGLEEFYLTIGTVLPVEAKDVEELDKIDTIEAKPFCRFVVTRTVMKQMIDLMEAVYNQQTQQINMIQQSEEQQEGN